MNDGKYFLELLFWIDTMTLSWNNEGVLPPISPGQLGHSPDRSPYSISMKEFVEMFGSSEKRNSIIDGLLKYRKALNQAGIQGFQWIGGSFVENIEMLEDRPPNDVDVVTFLKLPPGISQEDLFDKFKHLFDTSQTKSLYSVDGYMMVLSEPMEEYHIGLVTYWYSMWSHRRNKTWKGYLKIYLSEEEDHLAQTGLLRRQS